MAKKSAARKKRPEPETVWGGWVRECFTTVAHCRAAEGHCLCLCGPDPPKVSRGCMARLRRAFERDSLPAGDLFSPKQTPVLYRGVKAGNDIWNAPEARGARPEREDLTCPLSFTRSLAIAKEFADWRKPGRVHAVHFARDARGRGRAVRGVDVAARVREDAGLLPQERAGAEREAEVMLWGLRLTRTSGGPRVTHWRAEALDGA